MAHSFKHTHNEPGVLHERGQVGALATRGSTHVQHPLVGLRRQGHDGKEGRGTLQNIMSGQIFWSGANRHWRVKGHQTHLGPFADRLHIHAAVNQSLGQVTAPCLERVGPQGDWTGNLVGFKSFANLSNVTRSDQSYGGNQAKHLSTRYTYLMDGEELHKLGHEELVVAVVKSQIPREKNDVRLMLLKKGAPLLPFGKQLTFRADPHTPTGCGRLTS